MELVRHTQQPVADFLSTTCRTLESPIKLNNGTEFEPTHLNITIRDVLEGKERNPAGVKLIIEAYLCMPKRNGARSQHLEHEQLKRF